jgi:hypothetical protein
MRQWILFAGCALLTLPALADDRVRISAQMQQLSDAIATGDVAVWDKYLDANVIYAEEDGSYKGKAEALKEITPLPKGLSGSIKISLLSYHEDGQVAVALFRQTETEHYFGQVLYASYLNATTWKRGARGWKLIAAQVLAERNDPPEISLSESQLEQYVGTYTLKDSEAVYTLTLSNGKLVGTRDSHKAATWDAEACDVFFIKGQPRIRKIFQRTSAGAITGFVERRETWDIVWLKTS